MSDLNYKIDQCSGYKKSREDTANYVINHPEYFKELLDYSFNINLKNHTKACWVLELVTAKDISLINPYLSFFCNAITLVSNQSAVRPIAKICMFLSNHCTLTPKQEQQITEACLDWLILENTKVAAKAYAIRALFALGKKQSWIYPELKQILTEDYTKHSVAYRAVAKEILKKIK